MADVLKEFKRLNSFLQTWISNPPCLAVCFFSVKIYRGRQTQQLFLCRTTQEAIDRGEKQS